MNDNSANFPSIYHVLQHPLFHSREFVILLLALVPVHLLAHHPVYRIIDHCQDHHYV